jgi:hypothetical protein
VIYHFPENLAIDYFSDRASGFLPEPASDHDFPTFAFHVARIIGMKHHTACPPQIVFVPYFMEGFRHT